MTSQSTAELISESPAESVIQDPVDPSYQDIPGRHIDHPELTSQLQTSADFDIIPLSIIRDIEEGPATRENLDQSKTPFESGPQQTLEGEEEQPRGDRGHLETSTHHEETSGPSQTNDQAAFASTSDETPQLQPLFEARNTNQNKKIKRKESKKEKKNKKQAKKLYESEEDIPGQAEDSKHTQSIIYTPEEQIEPLIPPHQSPQPETIPGAEAQIQEIPYSPDLVAQDSELTPVDLLFPQNTTDAQIKNQGVDIDIRSTSPEAVLEKDNILTLEEATQDQQDQGLLRQPSEPDYFSYSLHEAAIHSPEQSTDLGNITSPQELNSKTSDRDPGSNFLGSDREAQALEIHTQLYIECVKEFSNRNSLTPSDVEPIQEQNLVNPDSISEVEDFVDSASQHDPVASESEQDSYHSPIGTTGFADPRPDCNTAFNSFDHPHPRTAEPVVEFERHHSPDYASTVQDCDEPEGNHTPASNYPEPQIQHTETIHNPTMAFQDRTVIASQLSDALALFNSFDESVKSLVTRLQSTDNNIVSKREHEGGAVNLAAFRLPHARNPNFQGRFATLSQIFGLWRPQKKCRIAIVGLGGVGKTELIVEFMYRARQVAPSTAMFWFGPDDIRLKESETSNSGSQLESWLRSHHDSGSLVVVDVGDKHDLFETASDRGSFLNELRTFDGTVILISRSAQDGILIARPHEICEVRALEVDDCVNLICDNLEPYAINTSTEIEMQELAKSLSCFPRAIIEAAQVINSMQMTLSQFLEMYSSGEAYQLRLLGRIDPYSKPNLDASVIGRGVFDLRNFRKFYPEPSRFLYQIYFLGGRSVPSSLVSPDDALNKILIMLSVRSHYMITEENETFSIHPLVYLAMRRALLGERPLSDENYMIEERKWYDEAVLAFSKHYPDASCENRTWWNECLEHLGEHDLHDDRLRVAMANIYHRESSYLKRKGLFMDALKMASRAKDMLPNPVPLDCLVIVQEQVNLLDFLAKYREVHEMLRGLTMEIGHPGSLWKKSMRAKLEVADCANRYNSAIDIFRQIRAAEEVENDKLTLSKATDDLGMALMHKGKYNEAAAECKKAQAERSSKLGSSHPDTLSSCHNLSEILFRDGKLDDALRCVQDALRGREIVLGPDHPETLYSKILRARIQISKAITIAQFDDAEAVLTYAMERLSELLSPSHPMTMTCKSEIARIMFYRGKYEEAEAMNQFVLAAREQGPWLEPATHPDTMTSRNQLVDAIRMMDGSKAADNLSERSLTERTVVLTEGTLTGDDFHPDQLSSLHTRAVVLSNMGQHLAALQKIDLVLLGRKAILGDSHPDYFISMTQKGDIMRAQLFRYQSEQSQTLDTIDSLHKTAYEGLSRLLGSEHPSTLQCATHMALAKRERGAPEAEGLLRQIHCAWQHNMGDFHPETLKSKGRLAEAMRATNPRYHLEAKKLWRDSCGGLTRIYGFDAYITTYAYKGYEKFLRTYPDP